MSDLEKSEGKAASSRHESDASPEAGVYHHGLLYDPDTHLSPEERAKIDRALVWRLDWILIPWNRKRREGKRDYLVEGKTEQEIDALGDHRPDFMYTL
ncbi:hypothetical protein PG994_011382 [Apiospora phragmitis]|uniref:Uncharacterized protein n=1 Tax=Apiospora phragmitis TaxID=2905665 RepID=A0ABR1TSS6_9PEZI